MLLVRPEEALRSWFEEPVMESRLSSGKLGMPGVSAPQTSVGCLALYGEGPTSKHDASASGTSMPIAPKSDLRSDCALLKFW